MAVLARVISVVAKRKWSQMGLILKKEICLALAVVRCKLHMSEFILSISRVSVFLCVELFSDWETVR